MAMVEDRPIVRRFAARGIVSLFSTIGISAISDILFAEPLWRSRKTLYIRIVLISISV